MNDSYDFTVTWPCADGSTLVYSGSRVTKAAALQAKIERIKQLSKTHPKKRTVQMRSA